ncbi:APC family permease [Gulosibacter sp. GYB002]|uniref:APC family permease n=1 Tax=Gulosibacter sp. GYB002 TaxID=2994391 RepID=UPI002F9633BD
MTSNDAAPPLRRVLGLTSTVTFGLAYMLPLTVFTTLGIANVLSSGNLVAAYLITLLAMLFTAFSYATMVRRFPTAGSAYTFARKSFGSPVGFLTGWALMLDYLLLPMLTYLVIGIYLNAAFPAVPQWVFFVGSLLLVTSLNILGIRLLTNVNIALLALQFIFIAVFIFLTFANLNGTPLPSLQEVFLNDQANFTAIVSASALLCFSFLGFDAVSTLAEETREPEKTLPRAVILVTTLAGVLFMILAAVSNIAFPDYTSYTSEDAASLDVIAAAGGQALTAFFTAAYVAGCFASVLASQATVSRILLTMGRDRLLPKRIFGLVHKKFQTPVGAILVAAAISFLGLLLDLTTLSTLVSFGALSAFTIVNLSVIKYLLIDQKKRGTAAILKYGVAPLIGVLLTAWLWTSLSLDALLLGIAWIGVGVLYLAVLTRGFRRPTPDLALDL